jgi:hypothetical protein
MNTLINLPFKMTDKSIEPNMITVRHKNDTFNFELQIWRETDEEYSFTLSPGGTIRDPTTFNLDGTKYVTTGEYLIELAHGVNYVDPIGC